MEYYVFVSKDKGLFGRSSEQYEVSKPPCFLFNQPFFALWWTTSIVMTFAQSEEENAVGTRMEWGLLLPD